MTTVLIGLGNVGARYAHTRHNVGFIVLDAIATQQGWTWRVVGDVLEATGQIGEKKIILLKPQTGMNVSGRALLPWLKRHGDLTQADITTISDELERRIGDETLKPRISPRGHNGLRDIDAAFASHFHKPIEALDYKQWRIGIGHPQKHNIAPQIDVHDYVLQNLSDDEITTLRRKAIAWISSPLEGGESVSQA